MKINVLHLVCALCASVLLAACGTATKRAPAYGSPEDRRIPDSEPTENDRAFAHTDLGEPVPKVEPKSRYGNPAYYEIDGIVYHVLDGAAGFTETGRASWYGKKFHGRRTSSGEIYDMYGFTAAHKTLPLPSYVRVTRLDNSESVIVKVNDRGPFAKGRIIDLSYAASKKLGYQQDGTTAVRIEVLASPDMSANDVGRQDSGLTVTPATEQTHKDQLFIQVGAFGEELRADTLASRLRRHFGVAVKVTPVAIKRSGRTDTLYRVRMGPFATTEQAESMLETMNQYHFGTPKIVSE